MTAGKPGPIGSAERDLRHCQLLLSVVPSAHLCTISMTLCLDAAAAIEDRVGILPTAVLCTNWDPPVDPRRPIELVERIPRARFIQDDGGHIACARETSPAPMLGACRDVAWRASARTASVDPQERIRREVVAGPH